MLVSMLAFVTFSCILVKLTKFGLKFLLTFLLIFFFFSFLLSFILGTGVRVLVTLSQVTWHGHNNGHMSQDSNAKKVEGSRRMLSYSMYNTCWL